MRLLLFLFLCLSLAAPPAAWARASSSTSSKETGRSSIDLSRPPKIITSEIIAHVREAARAGGSEKTAAAALAGLGRAHSELLSRVAALSSSSASASSPAEKKPKNEKRVVGEDGGREMMRSVLEAAAAREGRSGGSSSRGGEGGGGDDGGGKIGGARCEQRSGLGGGGGGGGTEQQEAHSDGQDSASAARGELPPSEPCSSDSSLAAQAGRCRLEKAFREEGEDGVEEDERRRGRRALIPFSLSFFGLVCFSHTESRFFPCLIHFRVKR